MTTSIKKSSTLPARRSAFWPASFSNRWRLRRSLSFAGTFPTRRDEDATASKYFGAPHWLRGSFQARSSLGRLEDNASLAASTVARRKDYPWRGIRQLEKRLGSRLLISGDQFSVTETSLCRLNVLGRGASNARIANAKYEIHSSRIPVFSIPAERD